MSATVDNQPQEQPAPSELKIRRAGFKDLAAVVGLWRELQKYNAGYEPRLNTSPTAAQWYENFMIEQITNDSAAVIVAEYDENVVGYIYGQIMRRPTLVDGDCGYIADLCVIESYRGKGIGRRLYSELRSWFVLRNIRDIEVQVVRANPASQAFWRKMGFGEFLRTLRLDPH